MKPRILIGAEDPLVVRGIESILERYFEVVGVANGSGPAAEAAAKLHPDVVILDVSIPSLNGIEAAIRIRSNHPETKLIFVTMYSNPRYLSRALSAGASAYVLKSCATNELLQAVRMALEGLIYVSGADRRTCAGASESEIDGGEGSREDTDLTPRQREVLRLVVDGRLSKEIAYMLSISTKTVDFHRTQIMKKLGARSAPEMVRIALEGCRGTRHLTAS